MSYTEEELREAFADYIHAIVRESITKGMKATDERVLAETKR